MKPSRLRRKSRLKRGKGLSRGRGPRPVNPERKKKRMERDFGDKADWVRSLCCLVCGHKPCDPHHYPTRAAGGTSKDLNPLCRKHHRQFHDWGAETWQERHDVDLLAEARKLERRWQERTP